METLEKVIMQIFLIAYYVQDSVCSWLNNTKQVMVPACK